MLLVLVGLVGILAILALGNLADSQSGQIRAQANLERARAEAQAAVIRAEAQAGAIRSAALLPWGVLAVVGVVGVLGLSLAALALVLVGPRRGGPPAQIIERQIVYLPAPGQRRAETWASLAAGPLRSGEVVEIEAEVRR